MAATTAEVNLISLCSWPGVLSVMQLKNFLTFRCMHPRQEWIHRFLDEYNSILQEYYERTEDYPYDDFNAWLFMQRVSPWRKVSDGNIVYYHHIFNNLPERINPKFVFNRISCAKFVYIKDISLRNIILSGMYLSNKKLSCQVVNFPEHTDLKEFLVPEWLFSQKNPGRIFNFNWIK